MLLIVLICGLLDLAQYLQNYREGIKSLFVNGVINSGLNMDVQSVSYISICFYSPHPGPLPKGAREKRPHRAIPSPLWGEG
jgi:hypothetical protein